MKIQGIHSPVNYCGSKAEWLKYTNTVNNVKEQPKRNFLAPHNLHKVPPESSRYGIISIRKRIENSRREYSNDNTMTHFTKSAVDNILEALTPKNLKYLDTLLKLNQSKLTDKHIVSMLKYIDSADPNEVKQKMECLKRLPEIIVETLGDNLYNHIYEGSFLDNIGNNAYPILLKTDLLTSDSPSNSFKIACRKIEKYIGSQKREELSNTSKSRQKDTATYFGEILLAGSMVSSNTFEDLIYGRTTSFAAMAERINSLEMEDVKFIREIARDAVHIDDKNDDIYPLSNSEVIKMINLSACNRELKNEGYKGIDINNPKYRYSPHYIEPNFVLDMEQMQRDLLPEVLETNGLDKKTVQRYMKKYDMALSYSKEHNKKPSRKIFWDTNYVYLLKGAKFKTPIKDIIGEMTTRIANPKENQYDTKQMFLDYITDPETPYGKRNKKTEQIFRENNINYDKWVKGNFDKISTTYTSKYSTWLKDTKTLSAKMWNRIPQESLFDGNYTTCCTGIDEEHGDSFPHYLLGTFANIIEVRNERGETVGMSRLFMAKVDEQPSLIIENIEVRDITKNKYLYNQESVNKYRQMIFDYANKIAQEVNEDETKKIPVYFSNSWPKVKGILDGLETSGTKKVEILGSTPDSIYINAYKDDYMAMDYADEPDKVTFTTSGLIDVTEP